MIVQNCLGVLKELHQIEEEIKKIKLMLSDNDIQVDEERIINELIKSRLGS